MTYLDSVAGNWPLLPSHVSVELEPAAAAAAAAANEREPRRAGRRLREPATPQNYMVLQAQTITHRQKTTKHETAARQQCYVNIIMSLIVDIYYPLADESQSLYQFTNDNLHKIHSYRAPKTE